MEFKKETIRQLRGLILFTVLVLAAAWNYGVLFIAFLKIMKVFFPFFLGGAIAFILNVPMRGLEGLLRLNRSKKTEKLSRGISLVLTVLLVSGVLFVVVILVVPELLSTIDSLGKSLPAFLKNLQEKGNELFAQNPELIHLINQFQVDQMDWQGAVNNLLRFLSTGAGTVLSGTVTAARTIVSGVTTFGIAFIFSMYILLQKEALGRQAKKLCRAFFPGKATRQIFYVADMAQDIFSHFLAGQCVEAVILGAMFFVTMTILRMQYALLIGVLIAFTALIPVFGSFIGCAVGAFLTLMVSPATALTFVIMFFVLQQIEGNLIYPHVVGSSVGLPSIWVLVAVTIGGSAFGIAGMLIFIPLCSVFYRLLREWMYDRLRRKEKRQDYPEQ